MTDYDRSKEKEELEALRAELLSIYDDNNGYDSELETMLKEALDEDYSDNQSSQEKSNNTTEVIGSMEDDNSSEDEAPVKVKKLTRGRSL